MALCRYSRSPLRSRRRCLLRLPGCLIRLQLILLLPPYSTPTPRSNTPNRRLHRLRVDLHRSLILPPLLQLLLPCHILQPSRIIPSYQSPWLGTILLRYRSRTTRRHNYLLYSYQSAIKSSRGNMLGSMKDIQTSASGWTPPMTSLSYGGSVN